MRAFILVFHLMLTLSMIAVILVQRSEGGGLGLGGGGNMGGLMTARGTSNFLTRLTAILATLFIGTNLLLGILARHEVDAKVILHAPTPKIEAPAPAKESPAK